MTADSICDEAQKAQFWTGFLGGFVLALFIGLGIWIMTWDSELTKSWKDR